MFKNIDLKKYDLYLIVLVILASGIGYMAVGSANASLQSRQIIGMAIGITAMLIVSVIDYHLLLRFRLVYYLLAIGLLVAVLLFGETVNGAKRWINIPGLLQFQPSEFTKILLILFYAQFIMKYKDKFNTFRVIFSAVLYVIPILFLIFREPNLSTTILFVVVFCIIMYAGGLDYRIIAAVLAVVIPAVAILFSVIMQPDQTLIKGYQLTRILAWLNPEKYADAEAYQQLNSVIAIGSGQLMGKGLDNNVIASVKNGHFISEPETDFIFAVIGEEMGFVGSAFTVIVLMLITLECLRIARASRDKGGEIIAAGMAGIIGFQSFMNVAVATMLMPNTGIPLPFVSYGLTSMVSLFIGIGLVLNVGMQRSPKY